MRTRLVVVLGIGMSGMTALGACGARTSPGDLLPTPEDGSLGPTESGSGNASSSGGVTGSSGSSSGGGPVDAGRHEAGLVDAGPFDAGLVDAGPFDAGGLDAGGPEVGLADVGPPDTGIVSHGHFCPADEPDGGPVPSCFTPTGVLCEYGDNGSAFCDPIFVCAITSQLPPPGKYWQSAPLLPQLCGVGTCPATYAGIAQGSACPTQLDCSYVEGQCNCTTLTGDGGEGSLHWVCSSPPGCPEPRPRLGTPCMLLDQVCDYGDCSGGISETCTDLGWLETKAPCVPSPPAPDGG